MSNLVSCQPCSSSLHWYLKTCPYPVYLIHINPHCAHIPDEELANMNATGEHNSNVDYYAYLGVSPDANESAIRQGYIKESVSTLLLMNPDTHRSNMLFS